MMNVSAANNYTTSAASNQQTQQNQQIPQSAFGGYGAPQFMQMLMAQITHQNPLEPMNDAEMMSQYVQLNSLQELQSIKSAMSEVVSSNQTGYAASLIGKTIKAAGVDGETIEGAVKAVTAVDGKIALQVGDVYVALEDVIEVKGA